MDRARASERANWSKGEHKTPVERLTTRRDEPEGEDASGLTVTTTTMDRDGDRETMSGSTVAAEVVKVLRDVGEGTQTTGVMGETRGEAESVANSVWEEVAELNRGLRRASRARGEVANKMAVHALAPHSLKALIDCGKTLGTSTAARSRRSCAEALGACEAVLAMFTTHDETLRASLRDDEQIVCDTYRVCVDFAVFMLEGLDPQDFDAVARWTDVLRACACHSYAERWAVKVMERMRAEEPMSLHGNESHEFAASEEVALMSALSESIQDVNIGETIPSIFSSRLVCELYSKTLAKCSTVLHEKMSKPMMRLSDLPRLLAQVCLDGLEQSTDRHTVEHVALEAERACSLLGPALTHDEHKLIASLVNICVKSSEWKELSSETSCALTSALYSVAVSSSENLQKIHVSFEMHPRSVVSKCVMSRICSTDLDVRDSTVKFLEATTSNDDVNDDMHGCVPSLLRAVLEDFPESFLQDQRFIPENAGKLILDSAPLTLIRLGLACSSDGAQVIAKCLISALQRAKLASGSDILRFIPAVQMVSFILSENAQVKENAPSGSLADRFGAEPVEHSEAAQQDAEEHEHEVNVINLHDELGTLFAMPENLMDDNPSEDLLERRLARLDAVLDAAVSTLAVDEPSNTDRGRNTLPELWGRLINAEERRSDGQRQIPSPSEVEPLREAGSDLDVSSGLCTFITSGESFQEQHWYFCYDCNLVASRGCCSNCAKVCHNGHRVVYSRKSRFFCDCGADGASPTPQHKCYCLNKRDLEDVKTRHSRNGKVKDRLGIDEESDSETEEETEITYEPNLARRLSSTSARERLRGALKQSQVAESLESVLVSWFEPLYEDTATASEQHLAMSSGIVDVQNSLHSVHVSRNFKAGSFELSTVTHGSEVQELYLSDVIVHNAIACSKCSLLAIAEGEQLSILDADVVVGAQNVNDKAIKLGDKVGIRPLSRNLIGFDIVNVAFNQMQGEYLAVIGLHEVHICTINSRGSITDRLRVPTPSGSEYHDLIVDAHWVPNSVSLFAITGRRSTAVFDLSYSPPRVVSLINACSGHITSSSWIRPKCEDRIYNVTSTSDGAVFLHEEKITASISIISLAACTKVDTATSEDIVTLSYSQTHDVLMACTSSGEVVLMQIQTNEDATPRLRPIMQIRTLNGGPCRLTDFCLPNTPGPDATLDVPERIFVRTDSSGESLSLLTFDGTGVSNVPLAPLPASVIGHAGYQTTGNSGFPSALIILRSDGSMQVNSFDEVRSRVTSKSLYMNKKDEDTVNFQPPFPRDFFEKLTKVTPIVDFGGSFNRGSLPNALRSTLQADDGYIEAPNSGNAHLSLELTSGHQRVIRGIRLHVGGVTIQSYAPSKLVLPGGRTIKFERESRRWYDVPFTCSESLSIIDNSGSLKLTFLADSPNQVSIRVDRMEVYACDKDTLESDMQLENERDTRTIDDALKSTTSRSKRHLIRKVEEPIPAWLRGTIAIVNALQHCELDLKSSQLRVCYESMLRKRQFIIQETSAHRTVKLITWKVLMANTHDNVLTAMNIKDNSTLLCGHRIAERVCPKLRGNPFSVLSTDLFDYFCAVRKLGRLAVRRPTALLDSSPYLETIAQSIPHVLKVGAGSWDAEEIVPDLVHAIIALLTRERDEGLVKCIFSLLTSERNDVRTATADTLLSNLVVINAVDNFTLDEPRRSVVENLQLIPENLTDSSGIRDLISAFMHVNDERLHESQASVIRTLSPGYVTCLNANLCKLPSLRGNIIERDALSWRLAIAAESCQLRGVVSAESRETLLHAYAITCELLRCLGVEEASDDANEEGYGAPLPREGPSTCSKQDMTLYALNSVIVYASAHVGALDVETLPTREKEAWVEVLARVSAFESPNSIRSNAQSMMRLITKGDQVDVDILRRAGVLLNMASAAQRMTTTQLESPWYIDVVPYQEILALNQTLLKFVEVTASCRSSLRYFLEHIDFADDFISTLLDAAVNVPHPMSTRTCELISYIVEALTKEGDERDGDTTRLGLIRAIVTRLATITNVCALSADHAETRVAATSILKALWYAHSEYREDLMRTLMDSIHSWRYKGHRAHQLLEFVKSIVVTDAGFITQYQQEIEAFCGGVAETVVQISNHPRADLYFALKQRQLLSEDESDRYWLETDSSMRDVCAYRTCHQFTDHQLEDLKKNQSFTKDSVMTKLREVMTVQSIRMNVTELKSYTHVRAVEIWRTLSCKDMNSLRSFDRSRWQHVGTLNFSASAQIAEIKLEIPVDVAALNFVFTSFHENLQVRTMTMLHCPRCARHVTDTKHGICSNCRENAYQCRYCRNINYEKLDAFICSECGHCRYAKISTMLNAHSALCDRHPEILDTEDVSAASVELKHYADALKTAVQNIEAVEASVRRELFGNGEPLSDIEHIFKVVARSRRMEFIVAHSKRDAIQEAMLHFFGGEKPEMESVIAESNHYGILREYLPCALRVCTSLARSPAGVIALQKSDMHTHLFNRMLNPHISGRAVCTLARTILSNMAAGNEDIANTLCEAAYNRAERALAPGSAWNGPMVSQNNQDVLLLKEMVQTNTFRAELGMNKTKSQERSALMTLACSALSNQYLVSNPIIMENTVMAAMDLIKKDMTNPEALHDIVAVSQKALTMKTFEHFGDGFMEHLKHIEGTGGRIHLVPWLILALSCASRFVRQEAVQLLTICAQESMDMRLEIGRFLLSVAPEKFPDDLYPTFLSALNAIFQGQEVLEGLNRSDELVDTLIAMIEQELAKNAKYLTSTSGILQTISKDIGKGLQPVSRFFKDVCLESTTVMDRLMEVGLEKFVLIVLCNRALRVCQGPDVLEASETFDELLEMYVRANERMQSSIARICIKFARAHVDPRPETGLQLPLRVILEEISSLILPQVPPSKVYLLRLLKSATQEEFIPGTMARNPYSTAQLESQPLMRDVKNLICHELDMEGLIQDDFGMELLVSNQIISLDLTVEDVFERVWIPSLLSGTQRRISAPDVPIGPPMAVTFRLSGLDGEATEERVDELEPAQEEEEDIEAKFAGTNLFREDKGFRTLMQLLPTVRRDSYKLFPSEDSSRALLDILRSSCYVKQNRQHLMRIGALADLLDEAAEAFSDGSNLGKELLLLIEILLQEEQEVSESRQDKLTTSVSSSSMLARELEESHASMTRPGSPRLKKSTSSLTSIAISTASQKNHVEIFLAQLKQCIKARDRHEADIIARVIPRLAGSTSESTTLMAKNFYASVKKIVQFDTIVSDQAAKIGLQLELECSARLAEAIPRDSSGQRVLEAIWAEGTVSLIADYLVREAFGDANAQNRGTDAWNEAINRESLPLALLLLEGISRGYALNIADHPDLIALLHKLESVTEHEIGTLAENCLETLADCSDLVDKHLDELRAATREENRRKALARRQQMLEEMGMKVVESPSSPGALTLIGLSHSPRSLQGYESMAMENEQDSIVCRVCFEGYCLKPNEILGLYCFNKLIATPSLNGDVTQTVCTVSHFNGIHFSCHQSAKRADIALRVPKREWEGAALRNSETLCNNLLPIMGPMTSGSAYASAVDTWWQNCFAIGAFISPPSRARQVAWDVTLLLGRFAMNESFSIDSRGGGKDSNMNLLPNLVRLMIHQVSLSPRKGLEELHSVLSAVGASEEVWAAEEHCRSPLVPCALVLSIAFWSSEKWCEHRRNAFIAMLKHVKTHSNAHFSACASNDDESVEMKWTRLSEEDKLLRLKPALVYFGLINRLYEWLKPRRRPRSDVSINIAPTSDASVGVSNATESKEITEIVASLRDIPSMISGAKETLEWLDEAQDCEDLQGLLDVCGCLSSVLCDSTPAIDDFFSRAFD